MSRYTKAQIADRALVVIANNPGIKTSGLIQELCQIMNPSGKDCEKLSGRGNDKFSQKVRNLKSHNSLSYCVKTIDDGDKQNGRKWYTKPYYDVHIK